MQDLKKKHAFRCLVVIIDSKIREKLSEFLNGHYYIKRFKTNIRENLTLTS